MRHLETRIVAIGSDGSKEMGHLALINLFHTWITAIDTCTRISNVSQTVTQLDKGCIGSLANALIVLFPCPFSTCAPLVIGQRIGYLRSQKCLLLFQEVTGRLHHIVICQTGILDTVVIVAAKEQRQHIVLTGTHQVAKIANAIYHHVQMIAIGQ